MYNLLFFIGDYVPRLIRQFFGPLWGKNMSDLPEAKLTRNVQGLFFKSRLLHIWELDVLLPCLCLRRIRGY